MSAKPSPERLPPIVRAVLDSRTEAIAIFGVQSDTLYLNAAALTMLPPATSTPVLAAREFREQLLARGGSAAPLRSDGKVLGEMIVVPRRGGRTWAEEEGDAIDETLRQTNGRLAQAARRLGISRTTLWRRLRAKRR